MISGVELSFGAINMKSKEITTKRYILTKKDETASKKTSG